ncbi:MAG: FAD-binding monooxygenase [Hyphomonadaceae bacterium]|nr:FAD-binding monooxygenase [Hyphomonadaceae bacterium]
MQFHLDGYRTGDPHEAPESARAKARSAESGPPGEVDVLIVGCGPAGLTLAAQLSAFPEIETCIVEREPGPLMLGRADGVACRTVEMFNAFGFAEQVLKEAYWVNETAFWRTHENPADGIYRSGRIQDTEDGLSEFPHVILNQARVHHFYLEKMRRSPTRLEPWYSRTLVDLHIDPESQRPVTAHFTVTGPDGGLVKEAVRARYVVGCDGARSVVRDALGLRLEGDSANQAWGVMDVLATTDFPDIRLKCVINSAKGGAVVLIPREGGYLVRIYVEMDKLGADERVGARNITIDQIISAANEVFCPYRIDVKEVAWWSVYEIGQRVCNRFDDVPEGAVEARAPRVFIAGDACHTHSPKAGQGMNVSMQDAFNLGWKLAHVLRGLADPALLKTYSQERQAVAKELIDFDREWASLLTAASKGEGVDASEVERYFVRHGRYTAGTATRYRPSILTGASDHQHLATGLVVGARFHSAPVIRLSDAKPMQLGHVVEADGRWRLFLFAGSDDVASSLQSIAPLCDFLAGGPASPVVRYTPRSADLDSVFDVRAIFPVPHRALDIGLLPDLLLPRKGRLALRDYEKAFCIDPDRDIYALRGIDRRKGCLVVVRPDQFVSQVLPLDAFGALSDLFDAILMRPVVV